MATAADTRRACEGRPRAGLVLREALPGDEAPLGFLFDAVLRRDYFLRRGQLREMLRAGRHRVLVAELDSVLVGVAVVTRASRLVNALVHPAYRGLGIGRALVNTAGAREVRAKVDMSTGDPRRFYEKLGYERTGELGPRGRVELMRLRRVDGAADRCAARTKARCAT